MYYVYNYNTFSFSYINFTEQNRKNTEQNILSHLLTIFSTYHFGCDKYAVLSRGPIKDACMQPACMQPACMQAACVQPAYDGMQPACMQPAYRRMQTACILAVHGVPASPHNINS